jgi:hypothetical protein
VYTVVSAVVEAAVLRCDCWACAVVATKSNATATATRQLLAAAEVAAELG